jgi:hypothetical protein
MSKSFTRQFFDFMTAFEGAREASAAVRGNRKPSAAALKKLGLEASAFDSIDLR